MVQAAAEELRSSSAETAQHPGGQFSEQLSTLESEGASDILGCMNKNMVQRVGEVILLCLPCVKPRLDTCVWFGIPTIGKASVNCSEFSIGSTQMGAGAQALRGEAGELSLFCLEKDSFSGGT